MKKYLFHIILLATLFSSCKKVINVDLNNAPSQIVIEGIINNRIPATVTISQSVKFSSDNVFPTLSGAIVSIQDNVGNNYVLSETAPGTYTNTNAIGVAGRTYTMNVKVNNTNYTAISAMPQQVNFDTLIPDQIAFANKTIKVVRPQYKDPVAVGNNYQFVEYMNGDLIQNIYVWNDNVNNGGTMNRPLIYAAQKDKHDIATGDIVIVEMRCIDKNIYTYMRALADLNSNNTTPANPPSNISGGALGYFSAHTSQVRQIKMP
jgi:hypothetical protein